MRRKMDWIEAKQIVSKTKNDQWFGTDFNMNLYRGCHHGCIYCDSRSTCYHLEEFDRVRGKKDALEKLKRELAGKRSTGVIGTGAMSDPYNRFEVSEQLTKGALEIIRDNHFGVAIATKSALVARDVDLLSDISQLAPVIVKMTITTFDETLCRIIEPNVSSTRERFDAIKVLSEAGVFTGVLLMPILPFINDTEENISQIVTTAAEKGAKFIYPAFGVTLREGNREYLYQALNRLDPNLTLKYQQTFGNRYYCESPNAKQLANTFKKLIKEYGLYSKMTEITEAYKWQRKQHQLSIFDL